MSESTVPDIDDEPVFRPRPRKRAHPLTFALFGLVLAAAGFIAGVLVQKHDDHNTNSSNSAANSLSQLIAGRRTAANGTGAGGAGTGANGAGATAGVVKLVDGHNVYVTDNNGNIVKVVTTDASQVTKAQTATTKDIAPGDNVRVFGTQNADGSFTATSLSDTGANAAGGFGGFGRFGQGTNTGG